MATAKIYQVKIDYNYSLLSVKGSKPHYSYYSNLLKTLEALLAALVVKGWEVKGLNYTAVYRAIKEKGVYAKYMRYNGVSFFRIEITELVLNPKLNFFDLEQPPD
jgi:hypothetical protein